MKITKRSLSTRIALSFITALLIGCATYHPKPLSPSQTASSFEARTLDSLDLKKYLEANFNRKIAPWPPASWDFSMLALAALYYHPDLDAARAKWGVAQAGIITARQHPNPTIGFTPQYDINPGSGIPYPWILDFRLDIPIETAGKRGYRVAQANHLFEAARLNVAATAWQVRSRLRASLLNLFWASQSVSALERQLTLQEELVRLMEKRRAVGEVSQPEGTQARLSLDQARLSLSDAKKKSAEAQSQTADALGITVNAMNGIEISFVFFEEPARKPPPTELRRQALLNRPDVLRALAEYAASESALRPKWNRRQFP